ncbi:MAG: UvrD-helicase domain-containing protein, partial [Myxococcales bacterium]|nr:UvrD-helicase domain-containing protein [Myxococcales bacterium]
MIQPLSPLEAPLDGTTLIEASAGTGKTYTITTLVLRLLLERELDVTEILVVTFTRAATAELRDRVRRRLGEMIDAIDTCATGEPVPDATLATLAESRRAHAGSDRRRLVTALRDFDQAPILTIHAFCQRTLGEQALESRTPFDLEFLEDESQLVEEVAQDYWARVAYPAPRALVAHLRDVGLDAESLEQLAAQVVRDPEVAVLPAEVAAPEPFDDDAIAAALTRAAALWRDARDHILPLLDPEAGLHKSSYKRDDILHSWAPQLDRMASWEALPPFSARLTQQTLID